MKKFGFTLSELVVSLGVVGIIGAMTTVTIANALPDKDKIKVIKAKKVLTDVTAELLNDSSFYFPNKNGCEGLACTDSVVLSTSSSTSSVQTATIAYGTMKYGKLLGYKLHLKPEGNDFGMTEAKFTTTDGLYWIVTPISSNSNNNNNIFARVEIDTDQFNSSTCTYSSSCKKPDRFEFIVDKYGKVRGADPLTKAYLENPDKFNDRKADFARAKELKRE